MCSLLDYNHSAFSWARYLSWTYDGVDFTLPGNGGQQCLDFIHIIQRLAESTCGAVFGLAAMYLSYSRLHIPDNLVELTSKYTTGKQILLILLCVVFGIELGFKFATRQMIWILNPCHLTTVIQIYLLAAPPSKTSCGVFRLHMYMLAGASIALLFPVTNTRLLPFEKEVYLIQHFLILIVPYYLMRLGGAYSPDPMLEMSWAGMMFGLLYLYHFIPLQSLAAASLVNLNNMLCPAVSDPFYGPFYRIIAMTHQTLAIPLHGKAYIWAARLFLPHDSVSICVVQDGKNWLYKNGHCEGGTQQASDESAPNASLKRDNPIFGDNDIVSKNILELNLNSQSKMLTNGHLKLN